MIKAYTTDHGIVVANEDHCILVTEQSFDGIDVDTSRSIDWENLVVQLRLYETEQLAAAGIKQTGDCIVYNLKYEVGQSYTGKHLKDHPKQGMIVKNEHLTQPFVYISGGWREGQVFIGLVEDAMYQVLYLPADNEEST